MRQALEALESADWYIGQLEWIVYSPDDTGTHEERAKAQSAITALRKRIGEWGSNDLRQGDQMSKKPVASIKTLAKYEPITVYIGSGLTAAECVRYDDGNYYLAADADAVIESLRDECEALRAEVERLRTDGANAVRWAPVSAYWSDVLRDLFGPDARKGIDVLEHRWQALEERAQRDEALLRQALEALEVSTRFVYADLRPQCEDAIAALRERLGKGDNNEQ